MSKNEPNKNDRETYYGIGKDIVNEGIFERFPELIPYVGDNYYSDNHKRLIFIGDSNYFEKGLEAVSVFQDAKEWYTGSATDKLIPENKKDCVKCAKCYRTLNNAFKVANDVLENNKGIKLNNDWLLNEAAFYNYFLRPALDKGDDKRFKPEPLDRGVAGAALLGIIKCLEPQVIVFLSKLAFEGFRGYLGWKNLSYDRSKSNVHICYNGIEIHRVSHPSSPWWNRNNGAYGKARLEKILKENWL